MLICDLCKKPVIDNNVSVLRNILKEYTPSKDFCMDCLDRIDAALDGKAKILTPEEVGKLGAGGV